MNIKQVNVMVVTAHPDDAEFGAAGTIARLVREGTDVVYVVCTNGDKGSSDSTVNPAALAELREKEQLAAAKVLGVKDVVFLRHPDQSLEDTPEFRKEIVREIRRYRPEIVMTADPYRRYLWHRDHRVTSQVTMDAVYPYARDHLAYPDLLKEGLMPHKVREMWFWGMREDINYRSDITSTFETKMAALSCHKSQVGESLSPDIETRLRDWAKEMAKGESFALAEAFHREEVRW